nr:uncharacterized protein CTRU02_06181 [Colletotrichum truncatum]KAF6793309.1 hypothetical protein CTRU02_06181 [Colletotrichum truncatum]
MLTTSLPETISEKSLDQNKARDDAEKTNIRQSYRRAMFERDPYQRFRQTPAMFVTVYCMTGQAWQSKLSCNTTPLVRGGNHTAARRDAVLIARYSSDSLLEAPLTPPRTVQSAPATPRANAAATAAAAAAVTSDRLNRAEAIFSSCLFDMT